MNPALLLFAEVDHSKLGTRETMTSSNNPAKPAESLLIITGSMGAGKTAVLAEASDILAQRQIIHAAIDLDALGLAHLPLAGSNNDVMYENLRSLCKNYAAQGVQRFLLVR